MDRPEFAGCFKGIFGKDGGGLGDNAVPKRSVPEDVAHLVAEAALKICDDVVCGMAVPAGIAAVLNQRDIGIGTSDSMIALAYRRTKPMGSGMRHGLNRPERGPRGSLYGETGWRNIPLSVNHNKGFTTAA
jgi:hypothetical protein